MVKTKGSAFNTLVKWSKEVKELRDKGEIERANMLEKLINKLIPTLPEMDERV